MGCGGSKEKVCQNCHAPYSPVKRSQSLHYHKTEDSHHMVELTSSTLGSLRLDPMFIEKHLIVEESINSDDRFTENLCVVKGKTSSIENGEIEKDKEVSAKEEFAMGMIEAKTWSNMINDRIPKVLPRTPITTPPGEPEMINAWEMMEGLEDISPLRPVHHARSFSFNVVQSSRLASIDDQPTPRVNGDSSPKPLWLDLADSDSTSTSNSNDNSIISEFDPEVIASFRKALEDLPPANPFHIKPLDDEKKPALINKVAPRGTDKLVVYFTSLRGVRKTFEDCGQVRVILKGLGVKVDERDVSMHSGFKDELKELLGEEFYKGGLPRVFLGDKYIGGAEEIRHLNEDGKLEKMVESCELIDKVCEACGDIRFVPCETCSGSCKIYCEGDEFEEDDEEFDDSEQDEYGFQRCPDCNENGLIRCPVCCD